MLSEGARLAHIRDRVAAIAPGEWTRAYDGDGCFVEARGPMGELLPVARFDAGATDDEIAFVVSAPADMRFLLGLVDRAIARFASRDASPPAAAVPPAGRRTSDGLRSQPRPSGGAGETKDYAAECAMKCAEPAFRVFLEERHGLERPLTGERVAQKVRSLLGVTSRRELNVRRDAAGAQTENCDASGAQTGSCAAQAWAALRAEYDAWRRAGR